MTENTRGGAFSSSKFLIKEWFNTLLTFGCLSELNSHETQNDCPKMCRKRVRSSSFAFASILVCPQFEAYHQWSARREMVIEV